MYFTFTCSRIAVAFVSSIQWIGLKESSRVDQIIPMVWVDGNDSGFCETLLLIGAQSRAIVRWTRWVHATIIFGWITDLS